MATLDLEQRLRAQSITGRYSFFVMGGALLAVVGVALFVLALSGGNGLRAWHAFQADWIYFTGLSIGSLALVAAHKIANAKWSGVIIRFSEATVYFGSCPFWVRC